MSVRAELRQGAPALIAAFLGVSFGISSLYFYTLGVFMKPMQADLGWSRTGLSAVPLIGALTLAVTAPLVGRLTDHFGVRPVAGVSLLGLAGGFWWVSTLSADLTMFLLINALVHLFAAGTSPVVFTRLVNQWFDKARGLALGIALTGTGITGALAPRLVSGYIEAHGWRGGYEALAMVILAATPIIVLLIRNRPRPVMDTDAVSPPLTGISLAEARKTTIFWLLAALFFCVALGVGGLIVHFIPMLTDAGVTLSRAATTAGVLGVSVILGRVVTGALIDRFFAPRIATLLFSIAAAGCLSLAAGGPDMAVVAAFAIGFAMGAEVDLIGYLVARYFGMTAYGAIYGWQYAMFMIGLALSPLLVGAAYDARGEYGFTLIGAATLLACAAALATRLPPFPDFRRN